MDLVSSILGTLPLGIAMDNDKIERVVELKNRLQPRSDLAPWRWIKPSEVRCYHIKLAPVPSSDPDHVLAKRFI